MPRVTAAHEQEVRERIVLAALRVFAEKGFHHATMQDVVRESGLSVGAIYTWFAGKDELFLSGCDLITGQGLGELAQRLSAGRSTAERLAIAIGFFLDFYEQPDRGPELGTYIVQAWAEADQEPSVREMLVRRREQIVTAGQLLLSEGIARGELPDWIDAEALALAYSALLDGLLLQRIEEGPRWRRDEAERRARVVLELTIAAAGSARPVVPAAPPRPFGIGPSSGRRS